MLALGLPGFALDVRRVSFAGFELDAPVLAPDASGTAWLVNASDGAAVTARVWSMLLDPKTFGE